MKRQLSACTFVLLLWASGAKAEPYLAVQEGHQCGTCHASASGGGMRNVSGNVYSRVLLPAHTVGSEKSGGFEWTGEVLKYFKAGADVRGTDSSVRIGDRTIESGWELQRASLYRLPR